MPHEHTKELTKRGYLAVRLTGLREHGLFEAYTTLYEAIAERLDRIRGFSLHAPHRASNPGSISPDGLSPRDVYLLDRVQVAHSHVVVACLELPSLGVGAELQLATEFGIPIVAFYYDQAARDPSRLVLGMPSVGTGELGTTCVPIRYLPTPEGREQLLDALVGAVTSTLARSPGALPTRTGVAQILERRRQELGLSDNDLAIASGTAIGTVKLLSLAGGRLAEWAQRPQVNSALTIPHEAIDEDLVLLPSFSTTLRLARALALTPTALMPPG